MKKYLLRLSMGLIAILILLIAAKYIKFETLVIVTLGLLIGRVITNETLKDK
jgi:hypothetical protein